MGPEFSPRKFQALDPRKRALILARLGEAWLAADNPAESTRTARALLDHLGRLPSVERPPAAVFEPLRAVGLEPVARDRVDEWVARWYAMAERERPEPARPGLVRDHPQGERCVLPIHVLLDRIRSPFNTGAMIRCAEAAGCAGVTLSGYTPGPDHPRVRRAAMGAEGLLPVRTHPEVESALAELANYPTQLIGVEIAADSVPYDTFPFPFPLALAVGNEELGLSSRVRPHCRALVHIPMAGAKASLNVGQALAVVLFEAVRQYSTRPPESG